MPIRPTFLLSLLLCCLACGAASPSSPVAAKEVATTPGDTQSAPAARFGHQMVYDPERGQTIVFGGEISTSARARLGDTWAWDGAAWRRLAAEGPARMDAVMAYDTARRRAVLFGGSGPGGANLEDTWEWNGSSWSRVATDGPGIRVHPVMAYDEARQRIVLQGGADGTSWRSDTWEWDGVRWERRATEGPTILTAAGYDPVSRRVVAIAVGTANDARGMHAWNGSAWAAVNTSQLPSVEPPVRALEDPAPNALFVLYGGFNGPSSATWVWNGTTWAARPGPTPTARIGFDVALDTRRRCAVLFGGLSRGESALDDIWEMTAGAGWVRIR